MVVWALALREPVRETATPTDTMTPTWDGPATVDIPGVLDDGATYSPRLFLDPQTSVGVATAQDGAVRVILARAPGTFTQLRSRPAQDRVQVTGFAAQGDTVVWIESPATGSASLWRASLSSGSTPAQLTTDVGEASFYGVPTEVAVAGDRVTWTTLSSQGPNRTEVRSTGLDGGPVERDPVDGELLLSGPSWAVSVPGGPGSPVTLLNLATQERIVVTPQPNEAVACSPVWCRVSVTGEGGLVGIDVMRPDGSQRQRIAGPEASPTIGEAALLDRYVPLATNRADGVGLSLYDLDRGQIQPIAPRAASVGGRGSILWWSTGVGTALTWHDLDLSRLA